MNKCLITLTIAATVVLSGCSYKPQASSTELGDDSYLVDCSNVFLNMNDCRVQAQKTCPKGYEIKSLTNKNNSAIIYDDKWKMKENVQGSREQSLFIKCK